MTVPAGFVFWARSQGMTPWHPFTWTPEQHAAFMAWKAAHVAARHQARIADGTWALMGPDQQATALRDDETMATAPAPSRPYRICECHQRPRQRAEDRSPPPKSAREALAYLHANFAKRAI